MDVWADVSSGLPLRVKVYGAPAGGVPVLDTRLDSLELGEPSAEETDFRLSPTLDFSRGVALDEAAGADTFAPFLPPGSVAGLARLGEPDDYGAVGVYGRGPTALLAIPLRPWVAERLHDQLAKSRDSFDTGSSISLEVGPISVRLVEDGSTSFLLTGTVTPETLSEASTDLLRDVRRTE